MDITGIGSIFDFGSKVIDKIFPDKTEAERVKLELFKAQQAGQLAELTAQWDNAKAQLAVNQAEASSGNTFASSWRPFIGWTCGRWSASRALSRLASRLVRREGLEPSTSRLEVGCSIH